MPDTASTAFHCFSRLPAEIRLQIWEATWPEPRVVDVVPHSVDDANTFFLKLRPLCPVSKWPEAYHSDFDWFPSPPSKDGYPAPIALRVCRESRLHSLGVFALLEHLTLAAWLSVLHPGQPVPRACRPFYFNTRADVLFFIGDLSASPGMVPNLSSHYGEGLRRIERVVVGYHWKLDGPSIIGDLVGVFDNLRKVQILIHDGNDDDGGLATGCERGIKALPAPEPKDGLILMPTELISRRFKIYGQSSVLVQVKKREDPAKKLKADDDRKKSG